MRVEKPVKMVFGGEGSGGLDFWGEVGLEEGKEELTLGSEKRQSSFVPDVAGSGIVSIESGLGVPSSTTVVLASEVVLKIDEA